MSNTELAQLSDDLLTFYSAMFFKGSTDKAKESLDTQHTKIRTKDAVSIAFFGGMTVVMLSFLGFFLTVHTDSGPDEWDEISSGPETYMLCFVLVFVLLATAFNIQMFRHFNVNYAFIFEVDQNYKLIHHQFYKMTLIFFFVWGFCFVW